MVSGLTETERLRIQFWTEFRSFARKMTPTPTRKPSSRHSYEFATGHGGFTISLTIRRRRPPVGVGCELYITHKHSKAMFQRLRSRQAQIDARVGSQLDWKELPTKHACRIVQYKVSSVSSMNCFA
jgi:hypothetical protein